MSAITILILINGTFYYANSAVTRTNHDMLRKDKNGYMLLIIALYYIFLLFFLYGDAVMKLRSAQITENLQLKIDTLMKKVHIVLICGPGLAVLRRDA